MKDSRAKLTLSETMEKGQINQVRGCKTAKDILDRLELAYADKSAANVYRMLPEFYHYKKQTSTPMSEHVSIMKGMRQ